MVKLRSSDWLVPVSLIMLSFVPAVAGAARLAQLAGGSAITPENARFFAAPLPVVLHIPASIVYSILGAFQFSPGVRRRWRGWHRTAGRILIPCAMVVAVSGLWMTLSYPWPEGDGELLYVLRLVFGSAMLLSVILGVNAIRRRKFQLHGAWMIRAYAIALGAGTQVLTHLPWFVLVDGRPGELPRAIMMGAGWAINVAVAEWIIRSRTVSSQISFTTLERFPMSPSYRALMALLLVLPSFASAIVIRHDVDDARYLVSEEAFPALVDLHHEGRVLVQPKPDFS